MYLAHSEVDLHILGIRIMVEDSPGLDLMCENYNRLKTMEFWQKRLTKGNSNGVVIADFGGIGCNISYNNSKDSFITIGVCTSCHT